MTHSTPNVAGSLPGRAARRTRRLRAALVAVTLALGTLAPATARAADNDDDMDGRMAGYTGKKVAIEKSSTTLTFFLFLGLTVVGCVPLFKNAKRD